MLLSQRPRQPALIAQARLTLLVMLALPGVAMMCMPPVRMTPPSADASAEEVALSGAAAMIGAGDIGVCDGTGDDSTAAIVDSVLKADSVAGVEHVVFTVGDNAYPAGTTLQFARCFGASWGDSTRRIMKWIRPALGNHEYQTMSATPYFTYFGDRAGERGRGYYAYDIGEWRAIVLNSEILPLSTLDPENGPDQGTWLREELKDPQRACTVAYFHRPLWSSGFHGGHADMRAVFQLLHAAGVDLVLAGHEHHYERFAPMTPAGVVDTVAGITQIVIGTGGAALRGLRMPLAANSLAQVQGHHGVLKLTLGAGAWRSAFIDVQGRVWDRSGGTCHQPLAATR
jgi:alkaline phosphatase